MRFEGGLPYTLYAFAQVDPSNPGMTSLYIGTVADSTNNDIGANPSAHQRCDP